MPSLNFNSSYPSPKGKKKTLPIILGIGALAGVIALGSTLAANINLNTGTPVEFGQGITQTVACSGDSPITITPKSIFLNVKSQTISTNTAVTSQSDVGGYRPNITPRGSHYFYVGIPNNVIIEIGMLVTGLGIDRETYVDFFQDDDSYESGYKNVYLTKEISNDFVLGSAVTFSGGGHYVMNQIQVGNIPSNCDGTTLIFKAYDRIGNVAHLVTGSCFNYFQDSSWDGRSIAVKINSNGSSKLVSNTDQGWVSLTNKVIGGFNINLGGSFTQNGGSGLPSFCSGPPASNVYGITVESTDRPKFKVGDTGPGGGKVFYYLDTGFNCGGGFSATGSPTGGLCHYLEAAPTTGANAWTDASYEWSGNIGDVIGTTGTAIGTGYKNTLAMIAQAAGGSAKGKAGTISRSYLGPNSLTDWYLPSKDELYELYLQQATVGGFLVDHYWSSSEYSVSDCNSDPQCWPGASIVWNLLFSDDTQWVSSKDNTYYVRPVRAF